MKIVIEPENLFIESNVGESLMEALVRNEIPIQNICNGRGTCGKCKVRFIVGTPEPTLIDLKHLSTQEIEMGFRLACRVKPEDGMKIEVPFNDTHDRKEAALFKKYKIDLNSGLKKVYIHLPQPSLDDERGDWERVENDLVKNTDFETVKPAFTVLEKLPKVLRREKYALTAILWGDKVLDIEAGDTTSQIYGLAVDIGTTSIAVSLVDLSTANVLKVVSTENEQTSFGADVISRITYASEGREKMLQIREAVRKTINRLIKRIADECSISAVHIYKMTIVANTTMNHLFLGLETSHLAVSPFVSVTNSSVELSASRLGMEINPEGIVLMFPNIGGFVGGDTVGAVIGTPEILIGGNHLLIDLGTNCELFLVTNQEMIACSTAAGPAFEGAGIKQGMRAKAGAIEGVTITEKGVELRVIGDQKAIGICGSGLIEGIEQMRLAGIINKRGKMIDPEKTSSLSPQLKARIKTAEKAGRKFIFYSAGNDSEEIYLSQKDISQFQLAKGAVCAGIKTILKLVGMSIEELDSVILSGTFATYLKTKSILETGLVPNISPEKIYTVGNAAHVGALRALINQTVFHEAVKLAKKVRHIELGGNKEFVRNLMDSMFLERTN